MTKQVAAAKETSGYKRALDRQNFFGLPVASQMFILWMVDKDLYQLFHRTTTADQLVSEHKLCSFLRFRLCCEALPEQCSAVQ